MPQEQEKRRGYDPTTPHRDETEEKKSPIDKELGDLIDQVDKTAKRNRENAQKKQPIRQ